MTTRQTFSLLTIIATIAMMTITGTVQAAYNPVSRNVCTLMIKPFTAGAQAILGSQGDQYINYLHTEVCKNHVTYPDQYEPQPPLPTENSVKSNADGKHLPWTRHYHNYFNDSVQDEYYYKAFVDKFEIVLELDGRVSTDTGKMICDTPIPVGYNGSGINNLGDCEGKADDLWGGTTVSKVTSNDSVKITWDFAVNKDPNNNYTGRPVIWGNNGSDFKITDGNGNPITLNLTNENNRKLPFSVQLLSNDNDQIWSATTTSRVLLADTYINKSNFPANVKNECIGNNVNNSASGWCYLPPKDAFATQGVQTSPTITRTYYWFPIGSVATVWKEAPPIKATCASIDLQITQAVNPAPKITIGKVNLQATKLSDQNKEVTLDKNVGGPLFKTFTDKNVVGLLPNVPMEIKIVNLTFNPTNPVPPLNMRYHYSSALNQQTEGFFKDEAATASKIPPYIEYDDNDKNAYYTGGAGGTVIGVWAIDEDTNILNEGCRKTFTIPTPPPVIEEKACIDLEIYKDGAPFPKDNEPSIPFSQLISPQDGLKGLYVQGEKTPELTMNFKWSAISNNKNQGNFIESGNINNPLVTYNYIDSPNPNNPLTNLFTGSQTNYGPASSLHQTIVTVEGYDVANNNIPICKDSFIINPPPPPPGPLVCDDSQFMLTVLSSPLQPNTSEIFTANGKYTNGTQIPAVQWSATQGLFALDPNSSPSCKIEGNNMGANPFTVGAGCTVTYSGGAANSVISVTAIPQEQGPICKRQLVIPAQPVQNPVCIEPFILTPNALSTNGQNQNLQTIVNFNNPDNQLITATLRWNGSGTFDNTNSSLEQTKTTNSSQLNFSALFNPEGDFNQNAAAQLVLLNGTSNVNPLCRAQIESPEEECKEIRVAINENEICVTDIIGKFNGDFNWTWPGGSRTTTQEPHCINIIPPGLRFNVVAKGQPQCNASGETPLRKPELFKAVRRVSGGQGYSSVASISLGENTVRYQLRFEPAYSNTTVTIVDPISTGIQGYLNPGFKPSTGTISFAGPMDVEEQRFGVLFPCSVKYNRQNVPQKEWQHCFEGSIGSPNGIRLHKVDNPVLISYNANVAPQLTQENCKNGDVCQEYFLNSAQVVTHNIYNDEDNEIPLLSVFLPKSNEARVQLFCQYILSRAAGDIFLETDLQTGVDIRMCSEFESVTGPIFTPGEPGQPTIPKTGASEDGAIFTVSHEVCTLGQAGQIEDTELQKYYGSDVAKRLSSQICEVKLRTGSSWKKEVIVNNIQENIKRISRWGASPIKEGHEGYDGAINLVSLYNKDTEVLHIGGDAEINSQGLKVADGDGAHTIIVENGDLYINGNITYAPCTNNQCSTVRDIASLAFIVLNGNIYIDPSVTTLSGVFFVQQGDYSDGQGSGKLISGSERGQEEDSSQPLNIYGSVYGDIEPLFSKRFFSGDPSSDEGGIVIRFDQRVILNTPPGLRDVLNLSQTEVVR